ncbi:cytochrome P450 [Amycolatopsis sp. NPDC051061]|uniref:cytochrome P450 family protein n=1 Tax=Amycolatopsis sp. NPDC051061 TaxID=3155042 RepID=UPI0034186F57
MTTDIAFYGAGWWADPHKWAALLRERGPVHQATVPWGAQEIPVWVIARYAEAREAFTHPGLSKDGGGLVAILEDHLTVDGKKPDLSAMFRLPHVVFKDPPEHARLHRVLVKHFTRSRVERMRPRIEQMTAELLDDLPLGREVDLITDVAFSLPLNVICELIGVPKLKQGVLRAWTYALMEDNPDRAKAASRNMHAYLLELIETARANPGEDLLSALVQETDEDRLSLEELVGTLFVLFVAGHETTTALIGNAIGCLLDDDGNLWRELGQRPYLLPAAVKEFARFDPGVGTTTQRFTKEPVTIGGITIPKGAIVVINLLSVNRDSRHFDRADELVFDRTEPNLAFGHGIHYCLGAQLGSMETEVAIGDMTRRFPNARLAVDRDQLRRRQPVLIPHSWGDMPVILG